MLLVIIGHVGDELQGSFNLKFVYGFHLVMFFLLSGYNFRKKTPDREYVNDKFRRLMVPYFFTCLAIIITDAINGHFLHYDSSVSAVTNIISGDLIRSFFASGSYTYFGTMDLGTRIGALWFLPAMFVAMLIFQVLLHITDNPAHLGFCSAVIAITGYISARFIWLPFSIQSGMFAVFFLWLGYEIKRNEILELIKWYHYIVALLVFLAGIYFDYCNVAFVIAWSSDIILATIVGLSGCLLVYFVSTLLKNSRVLSYIGKNSMLVLCTHLYALETMYPYFNRIVNKTGLQGDYRVLPLIVINIIFAVIAAFLVDIVLRITTEIRHRILNRKAQKEECCPFTRDVNIDVLRGMIILSALLNLYPINNTLRNIINSYSIVSFVVLSGYFYKQREHLFQTLLHFIRTLLIPYVLLYISILIRDKESLSQDNMTIFPVYFLFVLFAVKALYALLDKYIKNRYYKFFFIVFLSFVGMQIGHSGLRLPGGIDIALYALIFYQLGIYCKEYGILEKFRENHITYFVFTPVWAYMIYLGSINPAERNYGLYGMAIAGSMAGILILYKVAVYIVKEFPILTIFLNIIGKSSLLIVIVHTLFYDTIWEFVSSLHNKEDHIIHMALCMLLYLLPVLVIGQAIICIKYKLEKYHTK